MMEDIVLYCKSYHKDVDRAANLLDSITKYNEDNIPFYISVPTSDIELFKSKLGTTGYTLLSDNEIDAEYLGWHGQQVIKSQFWKLGICKNYVCLDSDSVFIRPFYKSDFLYRGDIPYTLCHEQKQLFDWSFNKLSFDPQQSFIKNHKTVMDLFNRKGRIYDFGPTPVIWSAKVWRGLEENYIKPNNLSFAKLIEYCGSEFTWYGEYLLASDIIPIYPAEPLFKVYHYEQQYVEDVERGVTLDVLSKNYLGVCLQSNWKAPLNY